MQWTKQRKPNAAWEALSSGDPRLQYILEGDGETYNPPRQYQFLELDQSWIITERFKIEPLPQTTVG